MGFDRASAALLLRLVALLVCTRCAIAIAGVEQYDYFVVIIMMSKDLCKNRHTNINIGVPAKPRLVIGLSHQNTSLELPTGADDVT